MVKLFVLCFVFFSFGAGAFADSESFDYPIFKTIHLQGFPNISVPIYKSAGKQGPAILMVHGNSSSSRAFVKQKISVLGLTHRVFLMDLPGFGRAGKVDANLPLPTQNGIPAGFPEYQIGLVEAIAAVANDPDVQAQVVIGWSLGGDLMLLAQGAGLMPNVKGIMMFGTAPTGAESPTTVAPFLPPNVPGLPVSILASFGFGFEFDSSSPLGFSFNAEFTDPVPAYAPAPISNAADIGTAYTRAFFNHSHRNLGLVPEFVKQDAFDRADPRARASVGVFAFGILPAGSVALPDELTVLKNLKGSSTTHPKDIPLAVLQGKEDAFINVNYLKELRRTGFLPTLWHGQVVEVPGAGHAIQLEKPIEFNLLVEAFVHELR